MVTQGDPRAIPRGEWSDLVLRDGDSSGESVAGAIGQGSWERLQFWKTCEKEAEMGLRATCGLSRPGRRSGELTYT